MTTALVRARLPMPLASPRVRRNAAVFAGLVAVVVWPFVLPLPVAVVNDATRAAEYALVAASLVMLTGWVGQISLAQGSFVGVGAFVTALVLDRFGIPFPYSLPFAVTGSTAAAVLLGIVALRVRGLYLAVATLIFAWMTDQFLFSAPWFIGSGGSATVPVGYIGRPGAVPSFDLHDGRVFYLVAVAALALGLYVASNVRDSKTGRAFFAIRGSEVAAASLGMNVTRYKLLAFGVSGAMAGLAGHIQIVGQGSAVPADFTFLTSLFFLSIAVVGGLTSLAGAVAAGILFSALNEVFFRVSALNGYIDLVSSLLLLSVLLVYPEGLAGAGRRVTAWIAPLVRAAGHRLGRGAPATEAAATPAAVMMSSRRPAGGGDPRPGTAGLALDRSARPAVLVAEGITVRFGGLVAVSDVSLRVHLGEIVGLIGPNGAGKTTLFNAIAGLNQPAAGRVTIFGTDATALPVHARAALGVGRTFQLIQLFPQLNVFDNLLAATHLANPTGFLDHLVVSERSLAAERDARSRVVDIVDRLGLGEVAHRTVSGLPFGVLRTVELGRALVTGAPFIMLDEPASGLDNAETDRLAQLLLRLRNDLGVTILLIEHDVAMVTGVSDHMYVVNRGRLLDEGTPAHIRGSQAVIAAYLGTSEPAPEPAAVSA